jgi:hypothetical protein
MSARPDRRAAAPGRASIGRAAPRRAVGAVGAVLAAMAVAACAALPGPPRAAAQPPATARPAPQIPAGPPPVPPDSTPSREALEVLRSIPDPLRPEERVPARQAKAGTDSVVAPDSTATASPADTSASPAAARDRSAAPADTAAAAPDSSEGTAAPDSTGGTAGPDAVPVPEPTQPLGERPGEARSVEFPDSLLAPAAAPATPGAAAPAAPGAVTPAIPGGTPPAAAAPDTCWTVQFAAPSRRAAAEARVKAIASLFGIGAAITTEAGLHKVRSADCLGRIAAERLRDRARLSGFDGAFTVHERRSGR